MIDERSVQLVGGPVDGRVIDNYCGGPVLVPSDEEAGLVARYRPTRDPGVLRFREYTRTVGTIPMPEGELV